MAIAKTASRNVAFKVAKMRDSIMEDQDELIIRKSECEELGLQYVHFQSEIIDRSQLSLPVHQLLYLQNEIFCQKSSYLTPIHLPVPSLPH